MIYTKSATKNSVEINSKAKEESKMLEKKDVVQKSFRIHKQNDIWLGLLALKLGRTQNELINIAIKMLLDDNKRWFFEIFIEATFREAISENGISVKVRLGDIEVEVFPINLTNKNAAVLNIKYFEDDSGDREIRTDRQEIANGPGYNYRLTQALVSIFEPAFDRYPQIMKNFNPGAIIDEC